MTEVGSGVMPNWICDYKSSVNAFLKGKGKKITALELSDNKLHFTFEDGYKMNLFDDELGCCVRYMMTDDTLSDSVGSVLLDVEVRKGPETVTEGWEEHHDTAFLLVTTSIGVFTCVTHNEHNGYYGGFMVRAEEA